jgi:hypothetical protein
MQMVMGGAADRTATDDEDKIRTGRIRSKNFPIREVPLEIPRERHTIVTGVAPSAIFDRDRRHFVKNPNPSVLPFSWRLTRLLTDFRDGFG